MNKLTQSSKDEILRLHREGVSGREISRRLDIPETTVRNYINRNKCGDINQKESTEIIEPSAVENNQLEIVGDQAVFQGVTTSVIRSEQDAIREFQIDTTVWYVDRMKVKSWTTTMKVGNDKSGYHEKTIQNYGVTLNLVRIQKKCQEQALNAVFDRMRSHSPCYGYLPPLSKGTSKLAVVGIFDAHFGKLCWGRETGSNYDLKLAETYYRNAVHDIVSKCESESESIERFLFPIGNDFFHIDNSKNTTFAGTPQDVDGRYARVIETGEMAIIHAIEYLIQRAKVDVVWVPGNHDQTTSFHLARTVAAWFRNTDRVSVEYSPSPRKYYHWRNTLLGLTHGDKEKKATLPAIMAQERKKEWASSLCCEWLCGHEHRSRKWQTQPTDTFEGVTVRTLQSIAGTDAWHHANGYISGSNNAAEVYFYDADNGYDGHRLIRARL